MEDPDAGTGTDGRTGQAYGETVASSSQLLEVECHQLYRGPAFGSFVRADCTRSDIAHFGVVTGLTTAPFESSRVVHAHRMPPGELEQRKPHLATLCRTIFTARIVGYSRAGAIVDGTAPQPASLHCYVYAAEGFQIRQLTASPGWLRALVRPGEAPVEDLLVSAIENAREACDGDSERLVKWGKYLARVLLNDYVTLEGVLQRVGRTGGPDRAPRYEGPLPIAR